MTEEQFRQLVREARLKAAGLDDLSYAVLPKLERGLAEVLRGFLFEDQAAIALGIVFLEDAAQSLGLQIRIFPDIAEERNV